MWAADFRKLHFHTNIWSDIVALPIWASFTYLWRSVAYMMHFSASFHFISAPDKALPFKEDIATTTTWFIALMKVSEDIYYSKEMSIGFLLSALFSIKKLTFHLYSLHDWYLLPTSFLFNKRCMIYTFSSSHHYCKHTTASWFEYFHMIFKLKLSFLIFQKVGLFATMSLFN